MIDVEPRTVTDTDVGLIDGAIVENIFKILILVQSISYQLHL